MARCPQCSKYYDDAMSFCLDDGSYLLANGRTASDVPTAEYGNALTESDQETETVIGRQALTIGPVPASGPSMLPVLVVVAVVIGGIVLLGAAGFAGLWYYASTASDDRTSGTSNPPVKSSPTPFDTLGVSDPIDHDDHENPANIVNSNTRKPGTRPENNPANKIIEPDKIPSKIPDRGGEPKPLPKVISGGVINGKAISLPKPPYPPAARAVRASGAVSVQVLVDENGNVVSANAVSGHPLLRAAATQAARGAKFSPTMLSGQPVKVSGVIMYNFVAP
jgi:TonB family protein